MKEQKKNDAGITLVALVVSIIVMLILAGVSLNMTVGENGIIKQAQNATVEQKCSELEEFIQEFYVKNYDHFENANTKIAGLKSYSESRSWIYSGKFGYIVDSNGNVHYYLDCDKLPKEMKDIIGSWTTKTYNDYVEGNDVYGITEDLKVYYQTKTENGEIKYYGYIQDTFPEENGSDEVFASGSAYAKLIKGTTSNENVTIADTRSVTELDINSSSGITNLNDLYNFVALKKLVISNMDLSDLNALEYNTNIECIFIQNCNIGNYSGIANLNKLKYLFFYNANDEEIRKLCDENLGIGGKDIRTLNYFGIYGYQAFSYLRNYTATNNTTTHSSFSRIDYLSKLSSTTKESITHLFLNNNSITSISNINEFKNVSLLRIEGNYLTTLNGIYDYENSKGMANIVSLFASNNLLGKDLEKETLNPNADALNNFSKATENEGVYAFSKNLTTISTLDLSYNTSLKYINYLIPCTTITTLNLEGCTGLDSGSVVKTASIINNATVCKIPSTYSLYLATVDNSITKLDLTNKTYTKNGFASILEGKTKLKWLKLNGLVLTGESGETLSATEINKCLNDTLKKLTALEYLGLYGLSNLTTVDFAEKTTKLVELDLRGTGATNLSLLDTYMTSARCVWIDNTGIDVTKIQNLISRCKSLTSKTVNLYGADVGGVMFCNQTLADKLSSCTNITAFMHRNQPKSGLVFDLRNCSSLNGYWLGLTGASYYLPSHITQIGDINSYEWCYNRMEMSASILNGSSLVNLKSIKIIGNGSNKMTFLNDIPNISTVNYFRHLGPVNGKISELTNPTKYERLYFYGRASYKSEGSFDNAFLTGIGNFSNLTTLGVFNNDSLTEFPNEINKLKKLSYIDANNTKIGNLYALKDLNSLVTIRLENTVMYETGFYTSENGKKESCDNMQIIYDLYGKKLRRIYLNGTNISDFSKIKNLAWSEKSGF